MLEKAAVLAEADARAVGDSKYRFPVDLRMYDMRHTANALMGLAGVPLEVARERMGHSSIKLTADTYGHVYASLQQDAATRLDRLVRRITSDDDGANGGALGHAFGHRAEAG